MIGGATFVEVGNAGPICKVAIPTAPVSVGSSVELMTVDEFRNGLRFTGHDTFADRNVFGIVLEVPNAVWEPPRRSFSGRKP